MSTLTAFLKKPLVLGNLDPSVYAVVRTDGSGHGFSTILSQRKRHVNRKLEKPPNSHPNETIFPCRPAPLVPPGSCPTSSSGNMLVAVATDYATGYAITRAHPISSTAGFTDFLLHEVILHRGAP